MKCPRENCFFIAHDTGPHSDEIVTQLAQLDSMYQSSEQLVASLVVAYTEMWAGFEALVSHTLGSRSADEQKEFHAAFQDIRKNLFDHLQKTSENGLENLPPNIAASMEHLVQRSQHGTTEDR